MAFLKSHQWMKIMDNWSSILLIIPKWVVSNLRAYILKKKLVGVGMVANYSLSKAKKASTPPH